MRDLRACLPFSASNSYRFCAPSLYTLILKPPLRPESLTEDTSEMWNEVVLSESKNALFSDGMICRASAYFRTLLLLTPI